VHLLEYKVRKYIFPVFLKMYFVNRNYLVMVQGTGVIITNNYYTVIFSFASGTIKVKILAVHMDCSSTTLLDKLYLQYGSNLYVHHQLDYVTDTLHCFSKLTVHRYTQGA
jgi:hypothetical protein